MICTLQIKRCFQSGGVVSFLTRLIAEIWRIAAWMEDIEVFPTSLILPKLKKSKSRFHKGFSVCYALGQALCPSRYWKWI